MSLRSAVEEMPVGIIVFALIFLFFSISGIDFITGLQNFIKSNILFILIVVILILLINAKRR